MSRRGVPGIQVVLIIGVVLVSIYGYYSYSELKSALRKSEETVKRVTIEEENLSTQLQALNEQKNQLEETMKKEKENAKKEKDDILQIKSEVEMRCKQEKKSSAEEIQLLTSQLDKQKTEYEELRVAQRKHDELDSEHEVERTRLSDEIKRLKQESDNELAVLRDQIADLKRQNDALREIAKRKLADSVKGATAGPSAGRSLNKQDRIANRILKGDPNNQPKANDNNIPQLDDTNQQDADKKEEEENRMQIRGPDEGKKPAYFEPKEAKPDHPVESVRQDAVNHVPVNNEQRYPDAEQVAPPKVDDSKPSKDVKPPQWRFDERESNRLKRGVRSRNDLGGDLGLPMNPLMPIGVDKSDEPPNVDVPVVKKESNVLQRWNPVDSRQTDNKGDQVEKPMAIAEPRLGQDEENQLQGPGMRNDQNANEKDDAAENGEENDEDYQYEEAKKAVRRDAVNGPHAAPVEDDEEEKDDGLL